MFGQFIHELTGADRADARAGRAGVHAVDAAGVHPLLLAIGSERYTPYERASPAAENCSRRPMRCWAKGRCRWRNICGSWPATTIRNWTFTTSAKFLCHALARVDWRRDLHFQTCTTIDTLDYSGSGLNEGSKVVIAAAGPAMRTLPTEIPAESGRLGRRQRRLGFSQSAALPAGRAGDRRPKIAEESADTSAWRFERFCTALRRDDPINRFPLVVIVDDSEFTAASLGNFLWVTFTRSNPAADIYGIGQFIEQKHWGCRGSLVIDARRKPHHAPPLVEDPAISRRVDALAAAGGPLDGII